MPHLILLPFAVFFTCCILQFWFLKKVRDALIDRHPETFLAVEKSSIFPMQGLWKFSRGSKYKQLGDLDLNRHIRNLKRLMIIGIIAWLAFAISIFTTDLSPPRLALALANGSYANSCCGTITLKDGRMAVSNQQIDYVIESDKVGSYVLPSFYVGASPRGFVLRRGGFPLKLYIDKDTHPSDLGLMDDSNAGEFAFHRLNDK